jgi:hypothetical protein
MMHNMKKIGIFLSDFVVIEELIIGNSAFWMSRNFGYAENLHLEKVHF